MNVASYCDKWCSVSSSSASILSAFVLDCCARSTCVLSGIFPVLSIAFQEGEEDQESPWWCQKTYSPTQRRREVLQPNRTNLELLEVNIILWVNRVFKKEDGVTPVTFRPHPHPQKTSKSNWKDGEDDSHSHHPVSCCWWLLGFWVRLKHHRSYPILIFNDPVHPQVCVDFEKFQICPIWL